MKKTLLLFNIILLSGLAIFGQNNQWVWMKGDSSINNTSMGFYGTQGIPNASNRPGARSGASTWTDASGNFWLFGGAGYGESANNGYLNDLWKYNSVTNQWTWISGDKIVNAKPNYGTTGVASATNKPGSRENAVSIVDANGNLWLYGGDGWSDWFGNSGLLNDLWKYNPATNQWTFVKGDKSTYLNGVYGTLGTAAAANKPGSRSEAVMWNDAGGNLWLFGGYGNGETGSYGALNDLWKYNPTSNQWAWIKGDKAIVINGVYGTMGTGAAANKPGGRVGANGWKDAAGIFWLFGGSGKGETGSAGLLNDLWKYSTSTNQWTWVKGDKTINSYGIFGTINTPAATNKPGGRSAAVTIMDASGNTWLFGGVGYAEIGAYGRLNDLWKYNPTINQWTWIKGDKSTQGTTIYGIQGIAASANTPGARSSVATWLDASGNCWIYGGTYYLNELWKFNIATNQWTWVRDYLVTGYTGIYGTQLVSAPANKPGNRYEAATWKDALGNLWLFGGNGNGGIFQNGSLNDLWKYDPLSNQWTWIKGDSIADMNGVYGSLGVATAANKPGGRSGAVTWVDANGKFWLFGGTGFGASALTGFLNDLWMYDPSANQWTWIKGDSTIENTGIYGTISIPANANKPGARNHALSWVDGSGNCWLFGGYGYGMNDIGRLNDLWKYSPITNQWVWIKGDNTIENYGVYNIQGTADILNKPGSRSGAGSWIDANGNFWMFGGEGLGESNSGRLNDLWKYVPATNQWTWVNGDYTTEEPSAFGIQGVGASANKPGGRYGLITWIDQVGNFWLFGGEGQLNDLWRYDPITNKWAWISGETNPNSAGIYGDQGTAAATNKPGSRYNMSGWRDAGGNFWLFGGYGFANSTSTNYFLNDLWKFAPCTGTISINTPATSFCYGVTTITLTASGGGATYEWYKDGILINGQTGAAYDAPTSGSYYVKSAVGACTIFSNAVLLKPATIPPSLGGTGVYCIDDPVNVGIPVTEIGQDYTWIKGGISVYGPKGGNGGNQSLQFSMSAGREGTYIVQSTMPGCNTAYSNIVYVGLAKINGLTATNICSGKVEFTWELVVPANVSQKYQYHVSWEPDPPASGTQTDKNNISIDTLRASKNYFIHVRSGCGFGSNFGDWTTISFTTTTAGTDPTGTITPLSASICTGGSQLLTSTGGASCQWLLNGDSINAANSSTYLATIGGTYSAIITVGTCSVRLPNSAVVTVSPAIPAGTAEWTGAVDNVWSNTANWKCGQVPDNLTTVVINGGKSNYPVITSNITVKSLTVNTGATVKVNPGIVLTVSGL